MKITQPRRQLLWILCFVLSPLYAQPPFPQGCEPKGFTYLEGDLALNEGGGQTIYFIHNRSSQIVELQRHETRDVFMSPKLHASIANNHWAAFASDERTFLFQCYLKGEGEPTATNCANVLDVCQYPRVRFALSNMGNYWVSTNKPLELVVKEAVAKGIYLKW